MSNTQHPNPLTATTDRRPSAKCMRHGVWMAACDECRRAHAPLVKNRKDEASAR